LSAGQNADSPPRQPPTAKATFLAGLITGEHPKEKSSTDLNPPLKGVPMGRGMLFAAPFFIKVLKIFLPG